MDGIIDICNNTVKILFISFFIYCVYIKIIDHHPDVKQICLTIMFDLIIAMIYSILKDILGAVIIYTLIYLCYAIFLSYLTKKEI